MEVGISNGYEPRFDINLPFGQEGELIVLQKLRSITDGGLRIEVKRDRRFQDTGRLYVETEQNAFNRGVWKPSGINTTAAEAWVFLCNNDCGLFLIDTPWLKRAVEEAGKHKSNHCTEQDGDNPTRGICIFLNHLALTRRVA